MPERASVGLVHALRVRKTILLTTFRRYLHGVLRLVHGPARYRIVRYELDTQGLASGRGRR